MVDIVVAGAAGRMGSRVIALAAAHPELRIAAAFERAGHPFAGKDVGVLAGAGECGVMLEAGLPAAIRSGSVVIDFTQPEASMETLEAVARNGAAAVVGTTGFSPGQETRIRELAQKAAVVKSPNMGVGVNMLFKIVGDVARILGPGFDLEIVETHHRLKKDAPSGTAVRLAEVLAEATGRRIQDCGVYGRQGMVGARTDDEIGVMALRAGDIVGEHTVLYGGIGERIEITHRAHSRDTFVQGALRAAQWVADRPAGLYDMHDVLGLR